MPFDKSQLMHGTLQGCILKIISQKMTYGYEILELLKQNGFDEMSEGTLYPLLLRLEKQGSIRSRLFPSPLGPRRKYFEITDSGRSYLSAFEAHWKKLHQSVNRILRSSRPCRGVNVCKLSPKTSSK